MLRILMVTLLFGLARASVASSPPAPLPPVQDGGLFCRLRNGTLLHVFQRGIDGHSEIATRSSTDNGQQWTPPATFMELDREHSSWGFGEVLIDRDDEAHIFFMIAGDKGIPTGGEAQRPLIGELAGARIDIGYARSFDHRTRWSAPRKLWIGYTGALNSVVQMDTGRILLPFSYLTRRNWTNRGSGVDAFTFTGQYDSTVLYTDDGGSSWHLSNSVRTPVPDIVSAYGAVEPVVVQLADGRVWMLIRTQMGRFWESWSPDGARWSSPRPTEITSSDSPAGLVRLGDGRIVLFWNCSLRYPYAYGGRQVLHAAISDDNARTWSGYREVGRDPLRNELPSNEGDYGTAYPMPALANRNSVLFVSGQGRGRVLRMRMDPDWLTETRYSADFTRRAEEWSTFGTRGVAIEAHPTKPQARVLTLRKTEPDWPAAAVWNFPSTEAGQMRLRIMASGGSAGIRISLADHFSTPFDLEDHLNDIFHVRLGPGGDCSLSPGKWHTVDLHWNVWRQTCRVLVDGRLSASLPVSHFSRHPCYLRLRSAADTIDRAGVRIASVDVQGSRATPDTVRARDLQDAATATLSLAMEREPTIQAMHAAEALVWNGILTGVRERYERDLASGKREETIAALRVLAQMPDASRVQRNRMVLRIRDMALDAALVRADFAIESLAKVGYGGRDAEFVTRASHAAPIMRILAQWVLANSGRSADEAVLAAMLNNPTPQAPGIAAYALRFLKTLTPATVAHLQRRLARMKPGAEGRVYLVSALYLHQPALMRNEMLRYIRSGTQDERYEALLVFGRRASRTDLPVLARMLRSPHVDLRTAAACSILRIVRRMGRP